MGSETMVGVWLGDCRGLHRSSHAAAHTRRHDGRGSRLASHANPSTPAHARGSPSSHSIAGHHTYSILISSLFIEAAAPASNTQPTQLEGAQCRTTIASASHQRLTAGRARRPPHPQGTSACPDASHACRAGQLPRRRQRASTADDPRPRPRTVVCRVGGTASDLFDEGKALSFVVRSSVLA